MTGAVIAYRGAGPIIGVTGHSAPGGHSMKRMITRATAALFALFLADASSAAALPPLGEQAAIVDKLVSVRVADRIRRTCPTIGARLFRVLSESNALKSEVRGLGYSEDVVRAFLRDDAERAKIYEKAEAYLSAHGAKAGDAETFCDLGRAEIAANTYAGSLIYEK